MKRWIAGWLRQCAKAFFFVGMALLLIGAAVGVALTDSMSMFYNFILMPGVGMLGYWLFRGKSFCSVGHFSAELSVPDPRNGLWLRFVYVGVVYVVLRTGPGNRVFAGLRFCEGGQK